MVPFHVKTAFPQFAGRHIDHLAAVSDIHRFFILAVILSKLFRAELFDGLSPPSPFNRKGRVEFQSNLLFCLAQSSLPITFCTSASFTHLRAGFF
jgi:hypothetical protein